MTKRRGSAPSSLPSCGNCSWQTRGVYPEASHGYPGHRGAAAPPPEVATGTCGEQPWPSAAVVHGRGSARSQALEPWPRAPLGTLSHSSTHQPSSVRTVLEDANKQGFIGFGIPPVHWDLHVVDIWQQHVQLPMQTSYDCPSPSSLAHWALRAGGDRSHRSLPWDQLMKVRLAWSPATAWCAQSPWGQRAGAWLPLHPPAPPILQRRGGCTAPLRSHSGNSPSDLNISWGKPNSKSASPKGPAHLVGGGSIPSTQTRASAGEGSSPALAH